MQALTVRAAATFFAALVFSVSAAAQDLAGARAAYEREDYDTAFKLYVPQAQRGNAEAQYRVGLMYKFGWGTEKDLTAAAKSLRAAADQQHAEAQAELGRLYKDGRGVPEDPAEAARWFLRAAQAGVGIAQLNIGRMYKDGNGVARDRAEAYAWFSAAAANGYMDGLSYRADLADEMSPEELRTAEKLAAERVPKRGGKK
jgi:hypothetical protein